jgi:hypothetical protein
MAEEQAAEVLEAVAGATSEPEQAEPKVAATEPKEAPKPTKDEEREAKEDALLNELDPGDEDEPSKPETEASAPADKEAIAEAYSVLRRDGFQPDDLKALDEQTILRLAEHRKKVQGDVDRLLRDAKGEKQEEVETDEQTQEDSEVAQPQAEATPGAPSEAYLQEAAKPIAEYLGLDEEGTNLLVKSYESIVGPVTAQLVAMQTAMIERDIEDARAGLAEEYPQVAERGSENVQRVIGRMSKMYDPEHPENYLSVEKLMEEAIALEFRDELRSEAKSATNTLKRYQRNGMSDTPKRQRTTKREMTDEEREDAVLELLESDIPDRLERAKEMGSR